MSACQLCSVSGPACKRRGPASHVVFDISLSWRERIATMSRAGETNKDICESWQTHAAKHSTEGNSTATARSENRVQKSNQACCLNPTVLMRRTPSATLAPCSPHPLVRAPSPATWRRCPVQHASRPSASAARMLQPDISMRRIRNCTDAHKPCHLSLRLSSTSRTTRSRRRSQPPSPPPSRRARSTPSPTCRRSWPRRPSPWRRASSQSTTRSSRTRRPRGGSR